MARGTAVVASAVGIPELVGRAVFGRRRPIESDPVEEVSRKALERLAADQRLECAV
jgi:hypothetical protein